MDPPTISKTVDADNKKRRRDEDSETVDADNKKCKRDEDIKRIIDEVDEIRDIHSELSPRSDNTATKLLALGLLQIGDWAADIVNNVRSMEGTARGMYVANLGNKYKREGLGTYPEGQEEAEKSKDWSPFGTYSNGTWADLSAEFDAVQKWRADGEPSGLEPTTPVID
ncbi:hypothetical protein DL764_003407 [Monosporascus ibericus]|uniref:Uncharacterized protein n=1 Tax=Monosporascus ibericus TaxID=155417 RepID=A0A4Q4TJ85_9PEZI|nr:hypothetical protein DL764_003407 [Monosporascus ibericus]